MFCSQEVSSLPCLSAKSKFIIIHGTYDRSKVHQTEHALRSTGCFNTFHVVSDPLTIVTFDIYGTMQTELSPLEAIRAILIDRFPDLTGYNYKVHYTTMEPYSSVHENEGIDISVTKVVAQHQHATVEFVKDLGPKQMRSALKKYHNGSIDFSIARTLLSEKVSTDIVYLPQWEELCVVVPRRHTRPLLIQLVKPFSVELWVFLVFYMGVRFTR